MTRAELRENIDILEQNNIHVCGTAWDDKPDSVELQAYTDAGEDMVICLEEPTRTCLEEYIDNFDIDYNIMIWWQNGRDAAHAKGVPFDNIRDHYKDYEDYLEWLKEVAQKLN